MPPRVTYWTGTWDPAKEAISKEIETLRHGARASAPVVAFSPAQRTRWRGRVVTLSHRRWLTLRAIAALIEPTAAVTHIFGGQQSWHLVRALGRRPIVLTAVVAGPAAAPLPHVRFARVVVETDEAIDEWTQAGVPRARIEIVPPGLDLGWHIRQPDPQGRPVLLFASTPADPAEIGPRGIPLLVDLARARPDVDVVVPWRQWGDVAAARRAIDALAPPANLRIEHGNLADMRSLFARASATIVAFEPGVGKSCPNFVIEGFAAGRPCIATPDVGLSPLIGASGAGVVAAREVGALSAAIDDCLRDWPIRSARARALAETRFDVQVFRRAYERIYDDVTRDA